MLYIYPKPTGESLSPGGPAAEDDAEGIPFGRTIAGQEAQRKLLSRGDHGETTTNSMGMGINPPWRFIG